MQQKLKYVCSRFKEILHKYLKMELIEKHKGHLTHLGTQRNGWEVWEDNDEMIVKMEVCYKDEEKYTLFDIEYLEEVLKREDGTFRTWNLLKNGYVIDAANKLYLHHLIMGKSPEGKSIDHIDRNKLDNRRKNLRWATPLEQTHNSRGVISGTKKKRRSNAQKLPEGLKEEDIPQYVCYKTRKSAKGTILNYFRIYCHPLQKEGHTSSKSWGSPQTMKISIQEKLQITIEKLKEMDEEYKLLKKLI